MAVDALLELAERDRDVIDLRERALSSSALGGGCELGALLPTDTRGGSVGASAVMPRGASDSRRECDSDQNPPQLSAWLSLS